MSCELGTFFEDSMIAKISSFVPRAFDRPYISIFMETNSAFHFIDELGLWLLGIKEEALLSVVGVAL